MQKIRILIEAPLFINSDFIQNDIFHSPPGEQGD